MVHGSVTQAQHQLDLLLFDWWPEINLGLRDDMSSRRPGYSFLSDPANHLQSKFRLLSQRAFSRRRGGMSWTVSCQPRFLRYLHDCDRFVQLLFAAIYMTSEMPERGEEVRVIRWANTTTVSRNIVCFQKKLLLIFPYNKACTNTNNAFYIIRTPSPAVGRMLFVFLVNVRLFSDMVARELLVSYTALESNRHLFTWHSEETACFRPKDCLRSLQAATSRAPLVLTMRMYRQIAAAMSKEHIPGLLKPFNAYAPYDLDVFLQLLAFQTGHKPLTHAGSYALETAFPSKLQPELIYRYLDNSYVWQKFLLLGEDDYVELVAEPISNASYTSPLQRGPATPQGDKEYQWGEKDTDTDSRGRSYYKKRSTDALVHPTPKRVRALEVT